MHNLSLTATNQNLIKRKFPYIDMFNHQGPDVVRVMRDLTVGVFEIIGVTSPMDVDKIIKYTQ